MKKRFICLMVLCLFILSNTAFATSWVLVQSYNSMGVKAYTYIDPDSVLPTDNGIIFWYASKIIKGGTAKVQKIETSQTNHQIRFLETYQYVRGELKSHITTPSPFYDDANFKDEITMALKYVKEGKDNDSTPTPP